MNSKQCMIISLLFVFGMVGHAFAGNPPAGAVAVYDCEQGADPNILYDSVSSWDGVFHEWNAGSWDTVDFVVGSGSLDGGEDGISINASPNLINDIGDEFSFAIWLKPEVDPEDGEGAILQARDYYFTMGIAQDRMQFRGPTKDVPGLDVWFPYEDRGVWSHWTFVKDAVGLTIYRNGSKLGATVGTIPFPPFPEDPAEEARFAIGSEPGGDHAYEGKMDDVRFYHRALTSAEIVAWTGDADVARDPSPYSSSTALNTYDEMSGLAPLSWTAGDNAVEHDVYFGTDKDAVKNRDASVFTGRQTATEYTPAVGLNGTYYWAIDEVNGETVWPGMLWTVALGSHLDVDNMEAYNSDNAPDDNWPYNTWEDGFVNGTGSQAGYLSQPFMERGIQQNGDQSLPFLYDNSKSPHYSEMSVLVSNDNITVGSDWTVGSPTALELWFYGDEPDNTPETLYLGLKSGNSDVVTGNYSGDIADVNQPQWHRLIVPLADFSAGGVDLTDVQEIYIGAGNRKSPAEGGTGTLLIDTIRLYPSRTLSDLTGIELDWNEDGIVNVKELKTFAGNWSLQDKLAKPSTGLWLKLDDTNQEVVDGKVMIEDSSEWDTEASISRFDGSAPTSVTWAEGACLSEAGPGALDLGTSGNVLSVTNLPDILKSAEAMTITMWWYNYSDNFEPQGCFVEGLPGGHPNTEGWSVWAIDYEGGDCIRIWDADDDNLWCGPGFNAIDLKDQWTHLAFVLSPEGTAYYVNGQHQKTGDPFGSRSGWQLEEGPGADLNTIRFGVHQKWSDGSDRTLSDAKLDDIRVYDNVLNEASIGSLMNCDEGSIDSFYVPLESIANIVPKVGDEGIFNPENVDAVDFIDFATFAESWRVSSPAWPY